MLRFLLLVISAALVWPISAAAQCGPEAGPCYRLVHYPYGGGTYCHRYYSGSLRYFGVRGSMSQTPISQSQIGQTVSNAYDNWYFNTALRVYLESAGTDTSGVNCRVAVINDALFSSNWGAAGSGGHAITFNVLYPDGTIKYNRTYVRGDNDNFDWQLDCTTTPCNVADADLPGVITHEMGHWWMLDDIKPPTDITTCDSVAMWYRVVNSATFMRVLKDWDIFGVNHLYDTPTSVGPSFTASEGPVQDTLRWEESDPSRVHDYRIFVSDACWGPFAFVAFIGDGDPRYTPDGRFYTYVTPAPYQRPYHYLLVDLGTGETAEAVSDRTLGLPPSPPSVPTGLTATLTSGPHVNLSWTSSSGTVTAYYLYRHWLHLTSCNVQNQAPWATLGPITGTSYTDTSPPCCDSLFYRVRAINSTGGSNPSAEATADLSVVAVADDRASRGSGIVFCGPNPTNGRLEVVYAVPREGRVTISIYDVAGRMIGQPVAETQVAGQYRTSWSPTQSASSSVAFVQLALDGVRLGGRRVAIVR